MKFNQPRMKDDKGNITVPRYSHSAVEIEHYGITAAIQSDGKIDLSETGTNESEKFQVSASLIFKLETLLKTLQKADRTYSPITIEHHGINATIDTVGDITLSRVIIAPNASESDELEVDEIEIPSSLVFKLSTLLRATRKVTYVTAASLKPQGQIE